MLDYETLMDMEGLEEKDVWELSEIKQIEQILPAEISTEVPGYEQALVCGNPFDIAQELDCFQGYDNPYGAFGTCGLTSIANICHLAGFEVSEPQVVEYAMENGLCEKAENGKWGGGTTVSNQLDILKHYDIKAHCEFPDVADCERIADAIEGGHGVMVGLNSGILQDREWKIYDENGEIYAGHTVCMTGTVRDVETGELLGFYLCVSSAQKADGAKQYVSVEKFEKCYTDSVCAYAVITDEPIR